jgi:hypothetical protein
LSSRLLSRNVKVKIYKTIILAVVLYGCETWFSTTRHEGAWGKRYSSYSFTTSRFTPGKRTLVPIVEEAGWASELVWTERPEEKSSNLGRPVVESVARHYTD